MNLRSVCILAVLAFASPPIGLAAVSLTCHNIGLDQVCPDDNLQRMCTCTSTGNGLRWRTNRNGVFNGTGVTFSFTDPVSTSFTSMGFTVILTSITNGTLTSIMTFTPTAVSSSGISVTCSSILLTATSTFVVTSAATPGPPQLSAIPSTTTCEGANFQVTLEWGPPANTGGPNVEIKHYLVNVTGFNCPSEQCNVTATNTTITGLKCNTSYLITVRAVNCIGEGSAVGAVVAPAGVVVTAAMTPLSSSPSPTENATTVPIIPIVIGVSIGAVIIVIATILIIIILSCLCCPCCLWCRRKCCPCFSENKSQAQNRGEIETQRNVADGHVIPTHQDPVPAQDQIYDTVSMSSTSGDIAVASNAAYGLMTGMPSPQNGREIENVAYGHVIPTHQAPVPAHDQQYDSVSMSSANGNNTMASNAAYGLMTDMSRPQIHGEIETQVNVAYGHVIPTHQAPISAQDQQYDPVPVSSTNGDIAMTSNAAYGLMTDMSRPQNQGEIETQVNIAYGHVIPTHQTPVPA